MKSPRLFLAGAFQVVEFELVWLKARGFADPLASLEDNTLKTRHTVIINIIKTSGENIKSQTRNALICLMVEASKKKKEVFLWKKAMATVAAQQSLWENPCEVTSIKCRTAFTAGASHLSPDGFIVT